MRGRLQPELRAIGQRAAQLLVEHLLAPRRLEGGELRLAPNPIKWLASETASRRSPPPLGGEQHPLRRRR